MGTVAPVLHRGDKPTEKRPDGKRARFRQSPELVPDLFRGLSLANIDSLMSPEGEFADMPFAEKAKVAKFLLDGSSREMVVGAKTDGGGK